MLLSDEMVFELKNVRETLYRPFEEECIKPIEDTMKCMGKNGVWILVDLPRGHRAIEVKWVLKTKIKDDGIIESYEHRFIEKGYKQQEGVDYKETLSLTMQMTVICLILPIVSSLDLELHYMHVKTTILNGELE